MPKLIGRVKNASFVGNNRIPFAKKGVYFFIQPGATIALMRIGKKPKSLGGIYAGKKKASI